MAFYTLESLERLAPGYAGILEPPPQGERQVGDWGKEDLILVPGFAFDMGGGRIGSGHGYYDRFLSRVETLKWGVCFSAQVLKEPLAQDPTDVRMDAVVTENGLL